MKGCYTALMTPFDQGKVDYDSMQKLIKFQIDNGIDGVIPCGTTGESPTLSHEEQREVILFTVEQVKKHNFATGSRVKVVAGSGSNSTEEALGLSRDAEKFGADALLIVSPYYNKPTQAGLLAHFTEIANSVESELIVYNIPGRTGILIQPETIIEMVNKCNNINTVKDATGDIDAVGRVLNINKNIDILSGNDSMNLPIYSVGGVGCISVMSNLFPNEIKEIYCLYQEGKVEEAKELHYRYWELCEVLFLESNPIPVKKAAKILGIIKTDEIRLPLLPASNIIEEKLIKLLK